MLHVDSDATFPAQPSNAFKQLAVIPPVQLPSNCQYTAAFVQRHSTEHMFVRVHADYCRHVVASSMGCRKIARHM
jgi:hypothetical protein